MTVAVLTVDQRGSRTSPDLVPGALAALADVPLLRPFERTAGDEFQGVVDDPASLARVAERLLREDRWNIGIGIGPVDEPLPDHARAGSGAAYLHARQAVTAAKNSPGTSGCSVTTPACGLSRRRCGCGRRCSPGVPPAAGRPPTSSTRACPTRRPGAGSASASPR